MSSHGREVDLTISSAKNIKNVNWRHGPNKPYAVVWVDPRNKCSTRVDEEGDTSPSWNERLVIPLPPNNDDDEGKIYIDIVHAGPEEDTKALIGSTSLKLSDVLNKVGLGVPYEKTLKLKRPSGRPHGKLDVVAVVGEPYNNHHGEPYGTHQYGQPQYPYRGPHADGYSVYEREGEKEKKKKESSFGGMGTGIAIGAVGGVLGGLAISEGIDAIEDDDEDDEGSDGSDGGGDDSE
ncbi:unnamed protein product [Cochlearia groenlandica]